MLVDDLGVDDLLVGPALAGVGALTAARTAGRRRPEEAAADACS